MENELKIGQEVYFDEIGGTAFITRITHEEVGQIITDYDGNNYITPGKQSCTFEAQRLRAKYGFNNNRTVRILIEGYYYNGEFRVGNVSIS